jgi:hypothetical protein
MHMTELDSIKIIAGTKIRNKSLPSFYFIIFYLPNIYMYIRPGVLLAWASILHRGQVASATLLPRQCHRQYDSTETSRHGQRRLSGTIANMTRQRHRATTKSPRQLLHQHDSGGLACTSSTSNLTWRITADQARGLEKYFSDQRPDSGTLLPTTPTSTQGERVITTMIWDTSANQLSHFS